MILQTHAKETPLMQHPVQSTPAFPCNVHTALLPTQPANVMRLLGEVQVVVQPLPSIDLLHTQTWCTVGERRKVDETPNQYCNDHARSCPSGNQALANNALADRLRSRRLSNSLTTVFRVELGDLGGLDVEDELDEGTGDERRCEVSRQVVV